MIDLDVDDRAAIGHALERILDALTLTEAKVEALYALGLADLERLRTLLPALRASPYPAIRDAAEIAGSIMPKRDP